MNLPLSDSALKLKQYPSQNMPSGQPQEQEMYEKPQTVPSDSQINALDDAFDPNSIELSEEELFKKRIQEELERRKA
jgi:hypothetical protein